MSSPRPWICEHCGAEQTHDFACEACGRTRFASHAIQLAEHVLEHLADGVTEPLDVLKAMTARGCYKPWALTLQQIAQQIRLLTKDTTTLARQLVKARSARTMLEVLETGDTKDKIAVLAKWGPDTNAEHTDHTGQVSTIVKHVYEELSEKKP